MFLRFKFFGIMPKFQEFSNLLKVAKPPFKNIHKSFLLSQGGTVLGSLARTEAKTKQKTDQTRWSMTAQVTRTKNTTKLKIEQDQ